MKGKFCTVILFVVLISSCEFQSYSDYKIPPYQGILKFTEVSPEADWSNRYEHAAVSFKDRLWIIGGYNPGEMKSDTYYEDVWSSADGISWELVTDNAPWKGRKGHTVLVFDDGTGESLFLIGGFSVDEDSGYRQYNNDVWKSGDGENWVRIKDRSEPDLGDPDTFYPRMDHASVVANQGGVDYMFIIGGRTQLEGYEGRINQRYFNDVWRSTDGIDWEKLPNNDYGIRANHAATVDPETGTIYIQGGQHGVAFESYDELRPVEGWNRLWSSTDGINWTYEFDNSFDIGYLDRVDHAIVYYEDAIWVFPGRANFPHHLIFGEPKQYNLLRMDIADGHSWSLEEGSDINARYAYASMLFNDKIWILGGFTDNNGQNNDVWTAEL
jgi:hypothetical protein